MVEKKKAAITAAPKNTTTKIEKDNDINKVFRYFLSETETTLGCMVFTGILRNSITYYVRQLERLGLLQVVYRAPDKRTHRKAKHYSSDKSQWIIKDAQLNLFDGKEDRV